MTSRPLSTAAAAYQYNPLSHEVSGQIGVLVVDEGEVDAPITRNLQVTTVTPESSPSAAPLLEWDAISYSWGGQGLSEDIDVDGKSLKVTSNVFNLIRDLRYQGRKRVLWIDAIVSIKLMSRKKSSQVPRMRQIYQRAQAVIIWLPSDGDKDRAGTALVTARWLNGKVEQSVNPQSHPSETLDQCFTQENPLVSWNSISRDSPFHGILARS